MQALIAAGASVDVQNTSGKTPLDCSLYVKQLSTIIPSLQENIEIVLAELRRMETSKQLWIGIVGNFNFI